MGTGEDLTVSVSVGMAVFLVAVDRVEQFVRDVIGVDLSRVDDLEDDTSEFTVDIDSADELPDE